MARLKTLTFAERFTLLECRQGRSFGVIGVQLGVDDREVERLLSAAMCKLISPAPTGRLRALLEVLGRGELPGRG